MSERFRVFSTNYWSSNTQTLFKCWTPFLCLCVSVTFYFLCWTLVFTLTAVAKRFAHYSLHKGRLQQFFFINFHIVWGRKQCETKITRNYVIWLKECRPWFVDVHYIAGDYGKCLSKLFVLMTENLGPERKLVLWSARNDINSTSTLFKSLSDYNNQQISIIIELIYFRYVCVCIVVVRIVMTGQIMANPSR